MPRERVIWIARTRGLTFGDHGPRLRPIMGARQDIQRMIPLLRTASDASGAQRSLLASGLVLALLALLPDAEIDPVPERRPGFEPAEFEAVLAFARARLAEHLDLAEWAETVRTSTDESARRFRQHTGGAPYAWFMDRRIDEAKRLMPGGDMPLVEIALDAGFCSQSHFTEAFRRRVGASAHRPAGGEAFERTGPADVGACRRRTQGYGAIPTCGAVALEPSGVDRGYIRQASTPAVVPAVRTSIRCPAVDGMDHRADEPTQGRTATDMPRRR